MRKAYRTVPPEIRFWSKVEKTEGCWLWQGSVSKKGYGRFLGSAGDAHRAAYEFTYGPIPEGLWVLHHCDTPSCVRPDHLYAGTAKQNHDDMVARGRRVGRTGTSKLTDENILELGAWQGSIAPLAARIGISVDYAQEIRRKFQKQKQLIQP